MKLVLLSLALLAGGCHFHSHRDKECASAPKCAKCHKASCTCHDETPKSWKRR